MSISCYACATMSEKHLTDQSFSNFDLPEELAKGISDSGFEFCTPIQADTLPIILQGRDVAGQAQTGTGKTAAFLIGGYAHLLANPPAEDRKITQPRAIILAPTRELAIQIHRDAVTIGKHCDIKLGLVYGGTGYVQQREDLEKGVDVLIGTPGRLIDYFKQGVFDLKQIQVVILDEADRMFDLGFITDIRYLFRRMPDPDKRLSMLFSATLSLRVGELAYEHMNDPKEVILEGASVTADRITETVYFPANEEKIPLLIGVLRKIGKGRSLIFINTKHVAETVVSWLQGNGFSAEALSGDVPQRKRERLLAEFTSGELQIMVATDVAARGLHIPEVGHVINYDLPQDPEDYVHRVGRTARAGASGEAISFACEKYAMSLMDIEQYLGRSLPVERTTEELLVSPQPAAPRKHGSRHAGPRPDKRHDKVRRQHKSAPHGNQGKPTLNKQADPGTPRQQPPAGQTSAQQPASTVVKQQASKPVVTRPRARRTNETPVVG